MHSFLFYKKGDIIMDNFKEMLIDKLNEKLGGKCNIVSNMVTKQNDEILHSIAIVNAGERVSKNIYLESYYKEYKEGRSIDSIAEDIIWIIKCKDDMQQRCLDFAESLCDYNSAKDNLMVRLINKDMNDKYLENKCYVPYLDFAMLLYVSNDLGVGESFSVAVTKTLQDLWKVNLDEMYSQALKNVRSKCAPTIESISSLIMNTFTGSQEDSIEELEDIFNSQKENQIYVLSNNKHFNGAVSMIFTDVLKSFAKENEVEKVIIIPSSVHEVLLYPKKESDDITEEKCLEMLLDVNATGVEKGEILSNNIYLYNALKDEVEIWKG